MKQIIIKNLVVLFFLLISLIIFIESLNFILSGVPIYDKLKINRYQLSYFKSKNEKNDLNFLPNLENFTLNKTHIVNCGYQESGIYHQIFNPDINGFWNYDNSLYEQTDVVMIGDSFGMSTCVNYPHDFRTQLEKLSKKKILNLSPGSSGPIKQLRIIEELTKDTKFDYFFWFFYEGNDEKDLNYDLSNNYLEKDMTFFQTASNFNQQTTGKQILKSKDEIFVDYKKLREIIKNTNSDHNLEKNWDNEKVLKIKIFLSERLRGLNSLIKYFIIKKKSNTSFQKDYDLVVNRMSKHLNKRNVTKRYIIYLPQYTRLVHKKKNHPEIIKFNLLKNTVKSISEKYNFEFIDSAKYFHSRKNPLDIFPYKLPNHYNENGYKILAEYVNKKVFK
tara:strand:+ start:862 stop:2028 length:1167 start_codon:yes stop_codon:yes gene_type:complete